MPVLDWISAIIFTPSSEWPPRAKKLSSGAIFVTPNARAQIAATWSCKFPGMILNYVGAPGRYASPVPCARCPAGIVVRSHVSKNGRKGDTHEKVPHFCRLGLYRSGRGGGFT